MQVEQASETRIEASDTTTFFAIASPLLSPISPHGVEAISIPVNGSKTDCYQEGLVEGTVKSISINTSDPELSGFSPILACSDLLKLSSSEVDRKSTRLNSSHRL